MKNFKSYIAGFAALTAMAFGFAACQDDVDAPAMVVPVAKSTPNTTIADLKAMFWQETDNYATLIADEADPERRFVIHGRVISSDEESNIFKSLVIQDETAALAFSINSYNLYLNYRVGQEIVMDVTGMWIGKYAGLMQMGMKEWYEKGNTFQISFMAPENFSMHAELNGIPQPALIDTIQVPAISMIGSTPEDQQKFQSQLVCLQNVSFQEGGKAVFSSYHSSGENRVITDANGGTMNVRTSGYSTFWNTTLPEGNIDLVGILSFFNNAWQFLIIDGNGWTKAPERPGAKDNPYTVDEAIASEANGLTAAGWVKGYIVGAVAPGVEEVTSADDIEWEAPTVLRNTLVIGQSADTKTLDDALVVYLTSESAFEKYGNLRDNPGNLGKEIMVNGTLAKYLGTYGITGNNGTASTFEIEGVTIDGGEVAAGSGSQESPYNVAQVVAINPQDKDNPTETGVWVKGYIVGFMPTEGSTVLSGTVFGTASAANTNLVLGPTADCTDYNKCIGIQLPNTNIRTDLNLASNPGNLGRLVALKGDIQKYCGGPGLKQTSEYVFEGGDAPVTPPDTPVDPVASVSENFDASTAIPAGWTALKVQGDKAWYIATFDGNNYASMTGYKGTAPFDSWLISPAVDLAKAEAKVASFSNQVNGYGSTTSTFKVFAMDNADPAKATLTELHPALATAPASGYSGWTESGELDLSSLSGVVYIGFQYAAATDANYATWCVDNVLIGTKTATTPIVPDDPVTPPSGDGVTVTGNQIAGCVSGAVTVDGYTFTASKSTGATAPAANVYNDVTTIRLYAANTLTIAGTSKIAKIVFTLNTSTGAKRYTTFTPSVGAVGTQAAGDANVTWTGNADSVTFTVGALGDYGTESTKPGQVHIMSIEITPAS